MMIRFLPLALILSYSVITASAQDAFKAAPHAYKLQFENDWVQVTRVHYGPYAKIPAHNHTRWPAAYVYLNDAGPIRFTHVGWDEPVLTRPPTKAGSFRLSPTLAVNETHEVENTTGIPSDFLRVEFKTLPVDRDLMRGRFVNRSYPARSNVRKVEFENRQIRATRLICAPHKALELTTSHPALLVVLSSGRVKLTGDAGGVRQKTLESGETLWIAGGQRERVENLSNAPIQLLMFDLKTPPAY